MKKVKTLHYALGFLMSLFLFSCIGNVQHDKPISQSKYENDWTSLRKHQTPQWLIDAKFGIYCHWGIQTLRYQEDKKNLSNDELIALFKGENFNAEEWAKLYKRAGARFGGVIGWHGSDYKHWDSQISDYNTAKMGPKIDVVGQLFGALRKEGIKTLVSYHSVEHEDWIDFAKEGVDKYSPDIFWVDASFGGTKASHHKKVLDRAKYIGQHTDSSFVFPEKYQREFISYFYNKAVDNDKEVEFVYKSHDIPPGVGMRDFENGILSNTAYDVWMTDIDMNLPPDWGTHGWFYREGVPLRSADELIDILVDVVSKNGIFLLNVPPLADGSFNDEVKSTLGRVGEWLNKNGEAIYGTSPWFIYGEGKSVIEEGNYTYHHNNHFAQIKYGVDDVRFTVKGDILYATCLGKPNDGLLIKALNTKFKVRKGDILSVEYVGAHKDVAWQHDEKGLFIDLTNLELDEKANVFKITLNL